VYLSLDSQASSLPHVKFVFATTLRILISVTEFYGIFLWPG